MLPDLLRLRCSRHTSEALRLGRQFYMGGETGAASASQTAVQQDLDHIFRLFLCQHNAKSLVASGAYVFFNIKWVNTAAVFQSDF